MSRTGNPVQDLDGWLDKRMPVPVVQELAEIGWSEARFGYKDFLLSANTRTDDQDCFSHATTPRAIVYPGRLIMNSTGIIGLAAPGKFGNNIERL